MVITRLTGGLGNQLFQYAAARRLSHVLQTSLKLDLSYYASRNQREYGLDPFAIQAEIATSQELQAIRGPAGKGLRRSLQRQIHRLTCCSSWRMLRESRVGPVRTDVINSSGDIYLDGYWQSEQYFWDVADIIRREFTVKYGQNDQSRAVAEMIKKTSSVSIHIRRGDYFSDPRTRQVHGVCIMTYYEACIAQIAQVIGQPHFFIFSDDHEWAAQHFRLDHPVTFVTHNVANQAYEDLRLMSMCQHHIIANSSFSWWGAWLGSNPDKIVLAPRKWFADPSIDARDVVPSGWIRVSVDHDSGFVIRTSVRKSAHYEPKL